MVLNGDDHGINGRCETILLQRKTKLISYGPIAKTLCCVYLDGVDDFPEGEFGGESVAMVDNWLLRVKVGDIESCEGKTEERANGGWIIFSCNSTQVPCS